MLRKWFSFDRARDRRAFVRLLWLSSIVTLFTVGLAIVAFPSLIWTLALPWWLMVALHPELVRRRNARRAKQHTGP